MSPLLVPVIVILRFTGEGEIFYLQERIGLNGKKFKIFKFATMLKNSPALGTGTVTIRNDPRVLPVGKFLRKTKINELPQLLNIFIGDMSVVGPRPLTDQTISHYSDRQRNIILSVRPGLSGIGSIIFRDEENILSSASDSLDFYKNIIAPYKANLELWYVDNRTVSTYFKVIIATIIAVIFPGGRFVWDFFSDLPTPPDALKSSLFFSLPK